MHTKTFRAYRTLWQPPNIHQFYSIQLQSIAALSFHLWCCSSWSCTIPTPAKQNETPNDRNIFVKSQCHRPMNYLFRVAAQYQTLCENHIEWILLPYKWVGNALKQLFRLLVDASRCFCLKNRQNFNEINRWFVKNHSLEHNYSWKHHRWWRNYESNSNKQALLRIGRREKTLQQKNTSKSTEWH